MPNPSWHRLKTLLTTIGDAVRTASPSSLFSSRANPPGSPAAELSCVPALNVLTQTPPTPQRFFRQGSRPYTRWWWLAGPFHESEIERQLRWLKDHGFGGVEIAWLSPTWLGRCAEVQWCSPLWSRLVLHAKLSAERLGLGCDFTFGSAWPFGGSSISPEHAARNFHGGSSQRVIGSWEQETCDSSTLLILNHLRRESLQHYAEPLLAALRDALRVSPSALFCDSLEIETREVWDERLWDPFTERFGYELAPLVSSLGEFPDVRLDYRLMISDVLLEEFYREFARLCREAGAFSRVQCHGAPTDLLAAYASVDVPESETLLFPPSFSRVAASAAALAGSPVVSCETFTCLHGFLPTTPDSILSWQRENVADLKMLADSVIGEGVNQIVWHGMPFNPEDDQVHFYASVHLGPDSSLANHLVEFNRYLEIVCDLMRIGRAESRLAVYFPLEDARMRDKIPREDRVPGSMHHWEMRDAVPPQNAWGYAPLWVSLPFLEQAEVVDGRLVIGAQVFEALLVDVSWLDLRSLRQIARLADAGLTIVFPRRPGQPGARSLPEHEHLLQILEGHPRVFPSLAATGLKPIIEGASIPRLWARTTGDRLVLFFPHPDVLEIKYPMPWPFGLGQEQTHRQVRIHAFGACVEVSLVFQPFQSVVVVWDRGASPLRVDVSYHPPVPQPPGEGVG